jgi:hypothetical protein
MQIPTAASFSLIPRLTLLSVPGLSLLALASTSLLRLFLFGSFDLLYHLRSNISY